MTAVRGHLAEIMSGTAKTKPGQCRVHGEFTDYQMPNGQWSGCPECSRENAAGLSSATVQEHRRQATEGAAAKLRQGAMIPRRYQQRSLDGFECQTQEQRRVLSVCRAYVDRFADRLEQGGGMTLIGSVGTGKSHLAYAIGNELLTSGYRVMGIDVYELIDLVKERAFSRREGSSEREAIKAFVADLDLLILDEVGAQLGTEWERLALFKIINERYKQQLPTILISNLDRDGLEQYLGERIIDRMAEGGGATLTLDWASHRQRGAA
ncbi:ATP-binding protein [Salinicola halophilus]|uniref:ATP-binding protein n=1 Tax=Salinicola halophilus TaxID=184065 RepID=UPI000DA17954|nr:ATP-binding protein [Salinicola halophilus]